MFRCEEKLAPARDGVRRRRFAVESDDDDDDDDDDDESDVGSHNLLEDQSSHTNCHGRVDLALYNEMCPHLGRVLVLCVRAIGWRGILLTYRVISPLNKLTGVSWMIPWSVT